jgi:hypothetical protein
MMSESRSWKKFRYCWRSWWPVIKSSKTSTVDFDRTLESGQSIKECIGGGRRYTPTLDAVLNGTPEPEDPKPKSGLQRQVETDNAPDYFR